MVDVAEIVVHRGLLANVAKRYIVFEAYPVDTNDTVTLGDMAALTSAHCWRLDTGAVLTCTVATNVVTVTSAALTDVPIVGLATCA